MSKSRLVKLLDTGEQVPREEAYYAEKQRRYFSSREAYEKWAKPDEYWNKTIGLLIEITDYPSNLKLPPAFMKRLREEFKGVGFEAVYTALIYKRKEIEYRMQINNFADYTHRLNYIFVMIHDDVAAIAKQLEYLKYNKHEKSFDKDEVGEDFDLQIPKQHKGGKDLSYLIGE